MVHYDYRSYDHRPIDPYVDRHHSRVSQPKKIHPNQFSIFILPIKKYDNEMRRGKKMPANNAILSTINQKKK